MYSIPYAKGFAHVKKYNLHLPVTAFVISTWEVEKNPGAFTEVGYK